MSPTFMSQRRRLSRGEAFSEMRLAAITLHLANDGVTPEGDQVPELGFGRRFSLAALNLVYATNEVPLPEVVSVRTCCSLSRAILTERMARVGYQRQES
jgi:hypothetical protein